MNEQYFIVDRVEGAGGATYVVGRTGDAAIPLAHTFTGIYPDIAAWRERAEPTHCSLSITEIVAYGHRLQAADPGLTARIQLSGAGIESLHNAKIIE